MAMVFSIKFTGAGVSLEQLTPGYKLGWATGSQSVSWAGLSLGEDPICCIASLQMHDLQMPEVTEIGGRKGLHYFGIFHYKQQN